MQTRIFPIGRILSYCDCIRAGETPEQNLGNRAAKVCAVETGVAGPDQPPATEWPVLFVIIGTLSTGQRARYRVGSEN